VSGGGRALIVAAILSASPAASLSAQCPDGSAPPCARLRAPLDTTRYVILPFTHREGTQPSLLDGADCAELLTEAFERWSDVRLADKTRVYDALQRRRSGAPFRIPFDTGLEIARQLGAGKLVMGQLWNFGDTLRLTASLYDAARGGPPLREAKARVPSHAGHVGAAFNALADSLLGVELGATGGPGAEQTHSLQALAAGNAGARAVRSWKLTEAAGRFRAAIAADSEFAHAYLWLGQTLLWAADSSPQAARDRAAIARRTGDLLPRLGSTDRLLLAAQQAMFQQSWPDACARYREILAADSTNFTAWYGLAECNAGDPVVIRDPRDSARYVFRGSWHAAARAYKHALLLAPSFNLAFGTRARERLAHLLLAEEFWWREGRFDTVPCFAFPEVEADTVAFHPLSGAVMAQGSRRPATHVLALARNRQVLVDIAGAWTEAFPEDPVAHRTLAYALEVSGRIAPTVGELRSALGEIATAKRLERRPSERARDAVVAVRLLVKAGEFEAARRAGDSLLRTIRAPTPGMAGVAILLGRPTLAAHLLAVQDTSGLHASADNESVTLPLDAALAGLRLLAYAAVAAPQESIGVLERRVEELLSNLPSAQRAPARSALLDTPAELVFEVMGQRSAHRTTSPGPDGTMTLQWALAHGDTAFVRAHLDTAATSPEYAYVAARMALSIGDTVAAQHYLDRTLGNLPTLYSALLDYMPLAGTLVRMMAFRADLAAARGQVAIAQRWGSAVAALWSGADPALQPTATRMRRLAATAP